MTHTTLVKEIVQYLFTSPFADQYLPFIIKSNPHRNKVKGSINKAAMNAKLKEIPNPSNRNGNTNNQTMGYSNSNKRAIGQHSTNKIDHSTKLINNFIVKRILMF